MDSPGQSAEIGNSLQFVIRQFDVEMMLQAGKKIESLQAVDSQGLKKIVVGSKLFPGTLKCAEASVRISSSV